MTLTTLGLNSVGCKLEITFILFEPVEFEILLREAPFIKICMFLMFVALKSSKLLLATFLSDKNFSFKKM